MTDTTAAYERASFMVEALAQAELHLSHAIDHLVAGNPGRFAFDLQCFGAAAKAALETYRELAEKAQQESRP